MKQKLLSIAAFMAAACMSSVAWAWTEPTMPQKPTEAGEFVVGGNYFIRLASCGQYLTGGNSYSTQISLTSTGINDEANEAMMLTIDSLSVTYSGTVVNGLGMKINGSYIVNGAGGTRTMSNTYFFRTGETGFVDWGSQTMGRAWTIAKVGDYYRIQTAANDPNFTNAANEYAGWNHDGSLFDDSTKTWTMATTEVKFNIVPGSAGFETYDVDWEFVPADNYLTQKEAYSIRVELLSELQRADSLVQYEGYIIDYSKVAETYENENASVEELNTALSTLKTLINRAEFKKKWEAATEDEPLDVTKDCLVNPDFSTGNISGWECTFIKGTNCTNLGYQSDAYDNSEATSTVSGEYGAKISQFIEAWTANGSFNSVVGDGTLQQTVYGMPAGKYVLHADVNAVDQYQGNNPVKGVYLFIQAGEFEATKAVATNNGLPEHFSVTFVNDGSDVLTFGLKTKSAQANWIGADNFQIFYYGESTDSPAMATLKETIKSAEEIEIDQTFAYAQTKAAFTDTLELANEAVDNKANDSTCMVVDKSLKNSIELLNASIKDYEEFKALIEEAEATRDKIEEQWPKLYDQLDSWINDTLVVAYEDGLYTQEEITAAEARLPQMIRDFIAEGGNVKEGDDLTLLITNADFSLGSGSTNIPGWTIKSGAITELSSTYHNIEAFHTAFDFAQTISNMPAGVYEVSVQGFVRLDLVSAATMTLYAGASTNTFKLLTDEYSLYPLLGNNTSIDPETGKYTDSDGSWPRDSKHEGAGPEGEDVYVPNSMQGAFNYFKEDNPATGKPFYLNTVKIVHMGGDLEIGVKCTSVGEWILWDNFTMKFAGNGISLYYGLIDDAAAELDKEYNDENAFVTAEALKQYTAVKERVAQKEQLQTSEEALLLISDINGVKDYIKAGKESGSKLKDIYYLYSDCLMNYVISTESSFQDTLRAFGTRITQPSTGIADNDAIEPNIQALKKAWSNYCLYDGKSATENEPFNQASYIILTPDYLDQIDPSSNSSKYWTIDEKVSNYATNYSALECFNDSTVLVYQDLVGLYEGYYKVEIEGFYRPGDYAKITTDSIAAIRNAKIFGTSSYDTYEVGMKNITEGGQAEEVGTGDVKITLPEKGEIYIPNNMESASTYFSCEFYKNELVVRVGENGELRIGVKKDKENHIANDWLIFTGWRLSYLGKQISAIEQVCNDSQVVKVQYFDLDGRASNSLHKGINIVRKTMSDGSTVTSKVLVR